MSKQGKLISQQDLTCLRVGKVPTIGNNVWKAFKINISPFVSFTYLLCSYIWYITYYFPVQLLVYVFLWILIYTFFDPTYGFLIIHFNFYIFQWNIYAVVKKKKVIFLPGNFSLHRCCKHWSCMFIVSCGSCVVLNFLVFCTSSLLGNLSVFWRYCSLLEIL